MRERPPEKRPRRPAGGLRDYEHKRDFGKTPEPRGGRTGPSGGRRAFVVQKHRASHLHYDFRLEADGVLKSWAVPKLPPEREGLRRLAVATEDHPLEYKTFQGVIPEGEYGAGTVEVWDEGTYVLLERSGGKWLFELKGRKLNGRYALIKLRAREGDDKSWLLIKAKKKEG